MTSRLRSRLRAARETVARHALPAGYSLALNRNDRVGALYRAWGHVFTSQIKGGYYEFGVYRGDSFRSSYRVYRDYVRSLQDQLEATEQWRRESAARYLSYQHHFYAFDTFQGMPNNNEESDAFSEGAFICALEEFTRLNQSEGIVEGERVHYFEGKFADVQKAEAKKLSDAQPAVVVNLDCDLYSSAKDALAIVAPKLIQGTVLLADDWNIFSAKRDSGERKAVAEFLSENTNIEMEPWFAYHFVGQAFLVHVT